MATNTYYREEVKLYINNGKAPFVVTIYWYSELIPR